jgi:hypothetical protein
MTSDELMQSILTKIDLLKEAIEYYAYNTQEYDFGYKARKTLVEIASKPREEVLNDSGREL